MSVPLRALPPPSPPPFSGALDDLTRLRATYAGTPDQLVDELINVQKQAGVPIEFVARSHFPLLELDAQVELMELLASGVAPHV